MRWGAVVLLGWVVVVVGACGAGRTGELDPALLYAGLMSGELSPVLETPPRDPGDVRRLRNCATGAFRPPARGPFRTLANRKLSEGAPSTIRVFDQIVRPGQPMHLTVEVTYGGEPLPEDWLRLFVGSCGGFSQVAEARTNGAGEAKFRMRVGMDPGVYAVAVQVVGDGSYERAELWVLPEETVVHGMELIGGAVQGEKPVVKAADLAATLTRSGELMAYHWLSGDGPPGSVWALREWLRKEGFPVGPMVGPDHGHPLAYGRFFGAEPHSRAALWEGGHRSKGFWARSQYCEAAAGGQRVGWTALWEELVGEGEK